MHNGQETDYKCDQWKKGDVIGLACDLDNMQMLVPLNGNFAATNGVVFELEAGAVGDGAGLFATFSGSKGKVRFNLGGVTFKYAPPSSDFVAFANGIDFVSAAHPQEDDESPSVAEIIERSAHGCPWMKTIDVKDALGILEAKGSIIHAEVIAAENDAMVQNLAFQREDYNRRYAAWEQAQKDAEQQQQAARQLEDLAMANPMSQKRKNKKCPHDRRRSRCQVFESPLVAVVRLRVIGHSSAYAS